MMGKLIYKIEVKHAWWLKFYLKGVFLLTFLTRIRPDMEKVKQTIRKGVKGKASACFVEIDES